MSSCVVGARKSLLMRALRFESPPKLFSNGQVIRHDLHFYTKLGVRKHQMSDYVAIIGTLAGVLVGGLVNFLATRMAKRHEWRLTLARDQIIRREQLYSDYLAEARRLTGEAIFRQLQVPGDVRDLDKMLAQMTLLSPVPVVDAARELRRYLVRMRTAENGTSPDEPAINQLSKSFVESARQDLALFAQ